VTQQSATSSNETLTIVFPLDVHVTLIDMLMMSKKQSDVEGKKADENKRF
jgi:hypothetical protein